MRATYRHTIICGLTAGVAIGVLAGLFPLLDGLTYELAVAVAVAGFAVAVAAGSWAGRELAAPYELRWKLLDPPPGERIEPRLVHLGAGLAAMALAAALPAVARGEQAGCAWESGILLYLFVTLPAIPLGLALGTLARVRGGDSRWRRAAVVALAMAVIVGLTLREVLLGPRAVLHNLVVGVLTTSAYLGHDEVVRIEPSHWLHRAVTLVLAALFLALAEHRACRRGEPAPGHDAARIRRLLDIESRAVGRRILAAASLLAIATLAPDGFGIGSGEATLLRRLSEEHRTRHFRLRFRPGSRVADLAVELGRDCEWAYERARRQLDLDPAAAEPAPITVVVYQDAGERRALTGADGFFFAKPWKDEIHIQLGSDDSLLALDHELVHVLAGRFGLPWIRVSARYGLIEGVAEGVAGGYAERAWRHEPVAAALQAGLLPAAAEVVGNLGFASRDAGTSYAAAASFCGFLLRRHGPAPLARVYPLGDFESAYGSGLADLDREWRGFLATVAVGPVALERARRSFDRVLSPPFFRRACARLGLRPAAGIASLAPSGVAGGDAIESCRLPWDCSGAPGVAAALSRLDAEAATGPLDARDRALHLLARGFARDARLAEAAAAIERRLDLAAVDAEYRGLLARFAADPELARLWWWPDQAPVLPPAVALVPAEARHAPPSAGARVHEVQRRLDRGESYRELAPLLKGIGGCGAELAPLEASLLLRGAVLARRSGDAAGALTLTENAAALADAGEDVRADAALERERLHWAAQEAGAF